MSTVLLVDSDADVRALLRSALEQQGYSVIEAAGFAEAVEELARAPIDLLVVDGGQSDGSSLEFLAQFRGSFPSTPIVLLSSFFQDLRSFRQLTDELSVSRVVYKPIEAASFAASLTWLLEANPRSQASDPQGPSQAPAPPPPDDEFEAMLALLSDEFAGRLPARLAEIEAHVQAGESERLAEAQMLAHKLRGSAGSYGFGLVGSALGVVEDLISESLERGGTLEGFTAALSEARSAALAGPRTTRQALIGTESTLAARVPTRALLVVDDDPDFLELVRAAGENLLVDVVTADSTEAALELAARRPLLAAILDVHLKRRHSFSLADRLRETPGNEGISIAFTSVDRRITTRLAASEAGASRFFEKPVCAENFAEQVQQFLSTSRSSPARVLVVDDDEDILSLYTHTLRSAGFQVSTLTAAVTLVDQLEKLSPDLLLLDINLPGISGVDVCRALRMSERWEFLPVILISADTTPETRLRAFRSGASDLIQKPVLSEELLARIRMQVERSRLLRERADRDALSGLMLRRPFLQSVGRALALSLREGRPLALVLIDLDDFKAINDTHGHLAGDDVISRFGDLLRRRFRPQDLRGRWGGEEFVLAFPGRGVEVALATTKRILEEFRALRFKGKEGSFGATFTAGVACFPESGDSINDLLRRADELLYKGKESGKNKVLGEDSIFSQVAKGEGL